MTRLPAGKEQLRTFSRIKDVRETPDTTLGQWCRLSEDRTCLCQVLQAARTAGSPHSHSPFNQEENILIQMLSLCLLLLSGVFSVDDFSLIFTVLAMFFVFSTRNVIKKKKIP